MKWSILVLIYMMAKNKLTPPKTIAVYIHWPFCLSLCPYCDFNSHVKQNINHRDWEKALLSELEHYSKIIGTRKVTSIFFGGGTPNILTPEEFNQISSFIYTHFELDPNCEITMENTTF